MLAFLDYSIICHIILPTRVTCTLIATDSYSSRSCQSASSSISHCSQKHHFTFYWEGDRLGVEFLKESVLRPVLRRSLNISFNLPTTYGHSQILMNPWYFYRSGGQGSYSCEDSSNLLFDDQIKNLKNRKKIAITSSNDLIVLCNFETLNGPTYSTYMLSPNVSLYHQYLQS